MKTGRLKSDYIKQLITLANNKGNEGERGLRNLSRQHYGFSNKKVSRMKDFSKNSVTSFLDDRFSFKCIPC